MRRRLSLACVLVMTAIVALLVCPTTAEAGKRNNNPHCAGHEVTAEVAADGSMMVTEVRTIEFRKPMTRFSRVISHADALGDGTVEILEAGEYVNGEKRSFELTSIWSKKAYHEGTYLLFEETQGERDVTRVDYCFAEKSNENAQFFLTYRLTGRVARWADIGELNWEILGDGVESQTPDVRCALTLPAPEGSEVEPGETVYAWLVNETLRGEATVNAGRVPEREKIDDTTAGSVVCTAPLVAKGDSASVRVLFPADWLDSMEASPERRRSEIIDAETKRTQETGAQREFETVLCWVKIAVVFALTLTSIVLIVRGKNLQVIVIIDIVVFVLGSLDWLLYSQDAYDHAGIPLIIPLGLLMLVLTSAIVLYSVNKP